MRSLPDFRSARAGGARSLHCTAAAATDLAGTTRDGCPDTLPERSRHGSREAGARPHSEVETAESNPRKIPSDPSASADDRDSAADSCPCFVAGEHALGLHLVPGCEHEGVREPQTSGSAAKTRRPAGDLGSYRLCSNGKVREKPFDLRDCIGAAAIGRHEDLGVHRRRNHQVVVLILGEGSDGRVVERIFRIEKRDDDRRIEND